MCITDTHLFHQTLGSEFEAFNVDPVEKYADALEAATDEQLISWLNSNGVTDEEIELCAMQGITLRYMVEDMLRYGNSFETLD